MSLRILMASLCVAGFALAPLSADAAKTPFKRDLSKEFEDLTPSEQIAIRAAAKAAYKAKKLGTLNVCADPGNMPFSNDKGEGFENKIANVLGEAMGAKVNFFLATLPRARPNATDLRRRHVRCDDRHSHALRLAAHHDADLPHHLRAGLPQ